MWKSSYRDKIVNIEKTLPRLKLSLKNCDLCFRKCGADRTKDEIGYCAVSADLFVYTSGPHHGEEPPISGKNGSGTIFFSHCNMGCVYCQNYKFSKEGQGKKISIPELSGIMLRLQSDGCHNINLVTPTPFIPRIVEALGYALSSGLNIPIAYNTGGYDSLEIIKMLDGIVDIYLPDMRYSDNIMAKEYSNAPGYVENNRAIIREMNRQVGSLKMRGGVAVKGLVIRLLMLPEDISGTEETLKFIQKNIGRKTYISLMSQYYPAYNANKYKELSRRTTKSEYDRVVRLVHSLGLENGWIQPFSDDFDPDLAGENLIPT
ncbi:MAG: radical SAM protein [Candidatus Omnitrophica bacterium]|nr:radical SAM protein [Candidatus Omnitrophota bacterium]